LIQDNNNQDLPVKAAIPPAHVVWTADNLAQPTEHELTLAELWLTFWKRRFVIVFFAAGVLLLAVMYAFLKTPIYESVAQIHVDPNQQGGLGVEQLIAQTLSNATDFDSRLQTEVSILQSDTVSMQVIKVLDLSHKKVSGLST
jgi:uncharacterized protein involved in exopolysaccharide biosynthesis